MNCGHAMNQFYKVFTYLRVPILHSSWSNSSLTGSRRDIGPVSTWIVPPESWWGFPRDPDVIVWGHAPPLRQEPLLCRNHRKTGCAVSTLRCPSIRRWNNRSSVGSWSLGSVNRSRLTAIPLEVLVEFLLAGQALGPASPGSDWSSWIKLLSTRL